jgi:adenylate cyclase
MQWRNRGCAVGRRLERLKALFREVVDPKTREHSAGIPGDGLLVEFRSVIAAMRCAVAVQRGATAQNTAVSAQRRIGFLSASTRVATSSTTMNVFGDGVNVAARLEGLAEPGTAYRRGRADL